MPVLGKSSKISRIVIFKPHKLCKRDYSRQEAPTFVTFLNDFSNSWHSLSIDNCLLQCPYPN